MWFPFSYLWTTPDIQFDVRDKVVIITGASSGIGKALAQALSVKGAIIVLAARRLSELQEVQASLSRPDQHLIVVTDVSKQEDCRRLMEQTVEKYGRINALINNAGISQVQLLKDCTTLDRYRDIMDINYFGTLYCTYYALPHLKRSAQPNTDGRGDAMIVAVSSMCGKLGVPTRTGYCASKHAIHGFLDSLRTELIMDNSPVHILLACPGYVRTDIRAVAKAATDDINASSENLMTAEECADAIIVAMEQKQREVLVVSSFVAKLAPYLRWFLPDWADRKVIEKQKGGRT